MYSINKGQKSDSLCRNTLLAKEKSYMQQEKQKQVQESDKTMELKGSSNNNNGVKVKFIETQFVSSDAASFKSVVQRLTGKSAAPAMLHRPQPCRAGSDAKAGWSAEERPCKSNSMATWQELHGAVAVTAGSDYAARAPPCLEELHELCDFSELFYFATSARRDGTKGLPY